MSAGVNKALQVQHELLKRQCAEKDARIVELQVALEKMRGRFCCDYMIHGPCDCDACRIYAEAHPTGPVVAQNATTAHPAPAESEGK